MPVSAALRELVTGAAYESAVVEASALFTIRLLDAGRKKSVRQEMRA